MKQKVASCIKITTKEKLIEWVDSLPVYISSKRVSSLLDKVQKSKYQYVLWRTKKVFTVW